MNKRAETCNDGMNPGDFIGVILKNKLLICSIVGATVIITAIVSLLMAPVFEATAVIAPPTRSGADVQSSGISGLAAQFGYSAPPSMAMSELTNLLKSDVLKEEVIRKHNLLPVLLRKTASDDKAAGQKQMWAAIRYLRGALRVTPSQKEHAIRLSLVFRDPKGAADILGYILVELTEHMSNEARRVADTNRKYLEGEAEKAADPFIRAKIYSLIAQQIETSMMAEVKENFAFKVIDPPRVPDRKIKPRRSKMVMIAFVVSLIGAVLVAFLREFWSNHGDDIKKMVRQAR